MNRQGVEALRAKVKEESRHFYKMLKDPALASKQSPYDYPHLNFMKCMTLCHTVVCDTSGITNVVRY